MTQALTVTASFNLAGADADGDGLPDTEEALLRSNPNNPDTDGDNVRDGIDNCPVTPNQDQHDVDGDAFSIAGQRLGDACDEDADNDGKKDKLAPTSLPPPGSVVLYTPIPVSSGGDNCPLTFNTDQVDRDGDQLGDACDPDADGDGFGARAFAVVPAELDPGCCPEADSLYDARTGVLMGPFTGSVPAGQIRGGDCDDANAAVVPQTGSLICDIHANAPKNAAQPDSDGDGLTDSQETDLGTDPNSTDTDSDGVKDSPDNCKRTANANQADKDGDGIGDACDTDADNDTVADKKAGTPAGFLLPFTTIAVTAGGDNCPLVVNLDQADADSDQVGNACEVDADNDGVHDKTSAFVAILPPTGDNCPLVANADQLDSDNDGLGNVCDPTPFPPAYVMRFELQGQDYNTWLPTDGATVTVLAKVIKTATNQEIVTPITVTPVRVTNWPGRYTNDPIQSDTTDVDRTQSGNTLTFNFHDFGGRIVITGTANFVDDGVGRVVSGTFSLPKDDNDNDLADAWEALYPGVMLLRDADIDESAKPAPVEPPLPPSPTGDGLTNLAEYRGVKWGGLQLAAAGGPYFTPTYVPTGTVQHMRLNPTHKDLFVKYQGYDPPGGADPFALGTAFASIGVDVHPAEAALLTANPEASEQKIDVALVTNERTRVFGFDDGHINKSGVRSWSWDTKGSSGVGTGTLYGASTTTFEIPLTNYVSEKPYRDGGAVTGNTDNLDPPTVVEDANDNGLLDRKENTLVDNDQLDGDRYIVGSFAETLSAFDVNHNSKVELPLVSSAAGITIEYTRQQVLKHTISHELGHAVGMDHTQDANCLMYQYSNDWKRDSFFSDLAKSQLKIHNQ
jgi:hypothetical protein